MKDWVEENRILVLTVAILFCLATIWLLYGCFGHWLIETAYKSGLIGVLNKIVQGQAKHSLEYYLKTTDRTILPVIAVSILIIFAMSRRFAKKDYLLLLTGIILVKIIYQIYLYKEGFVSVSADEFARGIRSLMWSRSPHIISQGIWLPFVYYVNGFLLMLWKQVILAPRLSALIMSISLIVCIYHLTLHLFKDERTAFFSAALLLCQPWFVWLSGTPMLDIYYVSFCFLSLYFILRWIDFGQWHLLILGTLFLMLATGFHYQSWLVLVIVDVCLFYILIKKIIQRNYADALLLIAGLAISFSFVAYWCINDYINTGRIFSFLGSHSVYSKTRYGGYNISVISKLAYYPRLVIRNGIIPFWLIYAIGAAMVIFKKSLFKGKLLLGLTFLLVGAYSCFNLFSVPATAAPGRFCLIFIVLCVPFCSYGFVKLFDSVGAVRYPIGRKVKGLIKTFILTSFIILFAFNIGSSAAFPVGMDKGTLAAGKFIGQIYEEKKIGEKGKCMLELRYWSFLGVKLASGYPEIFVPDREMDTVKRKTESILINEKSEIKKYCITENIKMIIVRSKKLKKVLNNISWVLKVKEVGGWSIFSVNI